MTKHEKHEDVEAIIQAAHSKMNAEPNDDQLKFDFVTLLYNNGRLFSALTFLDEIDEKSFSHNSFRLRRELCLHILNNVCNPKHPFYSNDFGEMVIEKLEDAFFLDAKYAFELYQPLIDHHHEQLGTYLLHRSAKLGYGNAQATLGYLYRVGFQLGQDDLLAFAWTKKAADQNNALGLNNLGTFFNEGFVVARNAEIGFALMVKSIELGCTASYGDVGLLLYNGDGITQDKNLAYYFWLRGSELASAGCAEYLKTYFPKH